MPRASFGSVNVGSGPSCGVPNAPTYVPDRLGPRLRRSGAVAEEGEPERHLSERRAASRPGRRSRRSRARSAGALRRRGRCSRPPATGWTRAARWPMPWAWRVRRNRCRRSRAARTRARATRSRRRTSRPSSRDFAGTSGQIGALVAEEPSFAVLVAAVAADRAAGVDHAMARNEQLDRAAAQRGPGGPAGAGAAGARGDVAVGRELAVRDGDRRLQHASPEPVRASDEVDGCRERPLRPAEVGVDLAAARASEPRAAPRRIGDAEPRLEPRRARDRPRRRRTSSTRRRRSETTIGQLAERGADRRWTT